MSTHDAVTTRPVQPSPVRTAVLLLWAKAVLALLGIGVALAYSDDVGEAAAADPQLAGAGDLLTGIGVVSGVVTGLVAAALWALCAVFTGRGHGWARILATVLAGLSVVGGLFSLLGLVLAATVPQAATVVPTWLTLLTTLVGTALSVAVIVLLWLRPSGAFFRAAGARAGAASY